MASKRGHHEIAELLLARGADPEEGDSKNVTALHFAAIHGHANVVQKFVDKKTKLRITDDDGMTPLHYAAKNNHVEACLVLLDGGAPVDAVENKVFSNNLIPLDFSRLSFNFVFFHFISFLCIPPFNVQGRLHPSPSRGWERTIQSDYASLGERRKRSLSRQ